ncbi:MAG: hypothetical protein V4619_05095 [Bacteroidota bacterium]
MPKTILKLLFFVLISFWLTSCATIFNGRRQRVIVFTKKPTTFIVNADTISTVRNQIKLDVLRQNKPLELVVVRDSVNKKVIIKPRSSFAYYANIYNYGIGYYLERNNPKRYEYPDFINLNTNDTLNKRGGLIMGEKGDFLLHFSLPLFNGFHISPDGEPMRYLKGGLGISAGFDYFHSDNQFINLSATVATDGPRIGYRREGEEAITRYLSLSNNHVINRLSLGYGLTYGQNTWQYRNWRGIAYFSERYITTSEGRMPETKSNNALGLIFSSHFRIVSGLSAGVVYRPTYIRFGTDNRYEHLISFDVAYKIRINKHMFDRQQRTRATRQEIIDRR